MQGVRKSFLLLAFLAAAVSCGKEVIPVPAPDPNDDYDSTITLSKTDLDLEGEDGATAVLRVTCDHEWFLLSNDKNEQTWLKADVTYGGVSKNKKVTFTAVEDGISESRTAKFKIVSGANTKKFTVTQKCKCLIISESDVKDLDRYYKPLEFGFDMFRSDSKWSWCRSKQSEHVVVFWDKEYGEYGLYGSRMGVPDTSPSTASSSKMRVDIDDLLAKAEQFYEMNTKTLKFTQPGTGKSVLDDYKFEIYILYQSEWLATGSGYDNVIGALWVNPSTCQPVGSTIAHEIGHAFQYMTFCDWLKGKGVPVDKRPSYNTFQGPGYRYGFGENGDGGCAFWEQCAQWQSFQSYKAEAFDSYDAPLFFTSTHLHVLHETPRYSNYFIQWWWCTNYGDISFIGSLWNNSKYPEDPCETYMRLMSYDVSEFNDDIWRYAAHCLTFDMDGIRDFGTKSIGKTAITDVKSVNGWWQISAAKAPESTGSNAIRLADAKGKTISVTFEGLRSLSGCKVGQAKKAGWRYGFVSYNTDGSTTYSDIMSEEDKEFFFDVPSDSKYVWLVVTGAPNVYIRHPWGDDKGKADSVWPWQAKFTNTKPYGK